MAAVVGFEPHLQILKHVLGFGGWFQKFAEVPTPPYKAVETLYGSKTGPKYAKNDRKIQFFASAGRKSYFFIALHVVTPPQIHQRSVLNLSTIDTGY